MPKNPSTLAADLDGIVKGRTYSNKLDSFLADLAKTDPEGEQAVRRALADTDRVSAGRLAEVLRSYGIDIADGTIANYRRKMLR